MSTVNINKTIQELILENSLAGYWDWNLKENSEYLSPTFKTMFGYEDHEMENHPDSWQRIIFKEDLPTVFENFNKHVETQGKHPFDQIVRYHHKEGGTVWVRCKGQVIEWDDDHQPIRMVGCHVDLTPEKKLEEEIKRITTTQQLALKGSNIGIWEFFTDTKVFEWSSEMYRLYGKERSKFSPYLDSWINCIHPEDRNRVREELSLLENGKGEFNTRFRVLLRGKTRHLKTRGVFVDGNGDKRDRLVGTTWDISQTVKVQEELETSRNKFEGAFEYSAIGMALVSLDGKWLKVNKKVCDMLGYTEAELMSKTFQDITHPDDLNIDLRNVGQMLKGEIDTYKMEKRYFHKNGNTIWVLLSVSLVRDMHNQPQHFVSQIKNITKEVEAKQALEKTVKLTTMQNDRLLNFAHIVSHNLRSHTGNLSMMLSFLKDEDLDDGKREQIMRHIDDISKTLDNTIGHLTEVVQIQSELDIKRDRIPLKKSIESVLGSLKADLIESQAIVNNDINEDFHIYFNPAYLDSVLLNLLSNAIRYRSPERLLEINVEAGNTNKTVFFSISDNGLGIDLKRQGDKIFGLNKTFHKHPDSRGVGLFITKNQIDALNGTIDVESEPDVGTTFKVTMPREN